MAEQIMNKALELDHTDELKEFRKEFYFPQHNGKDCLYFTGNSLGLQPKGVENAILTELIDWRNLGVEAHFKGKNPWFSYHHFLSETLAEVVGAKPIEVVAMNQLTSNLHFLFVSFYQPKGQRYKIIMEAGAFPSDMYLVESQVKFHGYSPDDAIIEISPREGEFSIRHEDIINKIEENKDQLALVFFSGVQYYTGQVFDIKNITIKAHEVGAKAGFDLAHAAGNIELKLHEWDVDFAAWCSYKYLNSGPGSVGGAFVHEKYSNNNELPRFAGWWGHDEKERFKMLKGFVPMDGAQAWQLSNAPVLSMAAHKTSLEIFKKAGISQLINKAKALNAYLDETLNEAMQKNPLLGFKIITPAFPERSCQLSILTGENGKKIFDYLTENGVIVDWRNPNVIRLAPVPLYNSFQDVYELGELLKKYHE